MRTSEQQSGRRFRNPSRFAEAMKAKKIIDRAGRLIMALNSADHLESEFREAVKAHSGALAVTAGALLAAIQPQIISLAAKYRMPAIAAGGEFVNNGGLMSYGPDRIEPYQRGAVMVDKILKGAKPADLPVEQPTKFELMINLKTAKALDLRIPPVVLMAEGSKIENWWGFR